MSCSRRVPHCRSEREGPHCFQAAPYADAASRRVCSGVSADMRHLLVIELLGLRAGQSMPGAQCLGDAPGLGVAAARGMRRIAVEDFTDCSDTGLSKVCGDALEEGERVRRVAINPLVCDCKGTQQPAPHRALVVAGVALARAAAVGCN